MRNEIQKKYSFEKKSKNKSKIKPTFFRLPNNRILIIKNYDYANKKNINLLGSEGKLINIGFQNGSVVDINLYLDDTSLKQLNEKS